jgi:hypothetical protein
MVERDENERKDGTGRGRSKRAASRASVKMNITDGGWPVIIAAGIAVVGVIISATISAFISRRASYLTSVTAERSKWIDKLRTNIAELLGLCAFIHYNRPPDTSLSYLQQSPEGDELRRKVETLVATIRLQLNPEGKIDQNIIEILQHIVFLADRGKNAGFSAQWLLTRHSQWLLKEEWETVKWEAAGCRRRVVIAVNRRQRERAYRAFCEDKGSLRELAAWVKEMR